MLSNISCNLALKHVISPEEVYKSPYNNITVGFSIRFIYLYELSYLREFMKWLVNNRVFYINRYPTSFLLLKITACLEASYII